MKNFLMTKNIMKYSKILLVGEIFKLAKFSNKRIILTSSKQR